MKHLDVLDHAGLITRVKSERAVTVNLPAAAHARGDGVAQPL